MSAKKWLGASTRSQDVDLSLTMIGFPGAGKTSFLAALANSFFAQQSRYGVRWSVQIDDTASREYLRQVWLDLLNSEPVRSTSLALGATTIKLTLRRRDTQSGSELETHAIKLEAVDTPGEVTANPSSRRGELWEGIKQRIAKARVVLVAVDAMNVFYGTGAAGQQQLGGLLDILGHACDTPIEGMIPLNKKALVVCFCKCDAQTLVEIDGVDDETDAKTLATNLFPIAQQKELERKFAAVKFFGVSILRREWRWLREEQLADSCVRVGEEAVKPIGVYEPFEWLTSLKFPG